MNEPEHVNEMTGRRQGFARQLLRSHLLVASIGFAVLMTALASIYYIRSKAIILAEETGPIAQASFKVLAGVQHSLAGLRGWVSLGDENYLDEWKEAWTGEIEPAMVSLMKHRNALKESVDEERLNQLSSLLSDLKVSQWWIKSVAQSPGNEPARVSYLLEVEPVVLTINSIMQANISQMKKKETSTQKEEIILFYDMLRAFSAALLSLEKIIFADGFHYEKAFRDNLHSVQAMANDFALRFSHSPEHRRWVKLLRRELGAFEKLADKAITERKSDKWNIALYLTAKETGPIVKRVTEITRALSSSTNELMARASSGTTRASNIVIVVMSLLICVMILAAYSLSKTRARALTRPIASLSNAAREFAKGRLDTDIPITSNDELAELTRSFNAMRTSLNHAHRELRKANEYLEQRVEQRTGELQATNKLFRREIVDRKRAEKGLRETEKQIKASLQEKEVLLREIHHRVKNNMQVIASLIRSQARKIDDVRFKRLIDEIQSRVKAMALIHEILYQSDNLSGIDLNKYINRVAKGLLRAHGIGSIPVEMKIDVESITLEMDQAVPCGLIINELIANSLEHAFPEKGPARIEIRGRSVGRDEVVLVIGDNGVGIPEGTDFRNTGTLGLDLVFGLGENQLGGTVDMSFDAGLQFTVRFKQKAYKERI